MYTHVSNALECVDTRDIQSRIDELESDDEVMVFEGVFGPALEELAEQYSDEFLAYSELTMLLELREEVEAHNSDWYSGATLIRESYFADYAEEFAYDIGAVARDHSWPPIDWDAAAEELKMDYAEVDFDGEAYYVQVQ